MGLFFIYKGGEWYCHKSQNLKIYRKSEGRSDITEEKKKLSQLELAEAIGVTQNTIYLIETAQSEMKLEKLFRIAEVLDVTPNKLLPGEAKTASNKFFEFEHMMKQLSEADQELIFNMVMPCMKRLLPNT